MTMLPPPIVCTFVYVRLSSAPARLSWTTPTSSQILIRNPSGAVIGEDEDARIPRAFSDPGRVTALKRAWDPGNVLHGNHNVAPGTPTVVAPDETGG
jgi:hypothetical protein